MKFTLPIEVVGIQSVVFDRKKHWKKDGDSWYLTESDLTSTVIPHSEMCKRIKIVEKDPRFRMWVHFDTLNVVRKEVKPTEPPIVTAFRGISAALRKAGYI